MKVSYAEEILYGNFIRYERMYQLTKYALYSTKSAVADIYIDMNSLLRILYRYDDLLYRSEIHSDIASSMINLVAHIRNYFWTRHRVFTNVFIVYGDNFPKEPRQINPSYNQVSYSEYVSKFSVTDKIKQNIEIMDVLIPYIDSVYFIHVPEVETAVLIKSIIDKRCLNPKHNGTPSVVFTKDPYCYQLVAMEPLTFIYRPKKRGQDDLSWVVTKTLLFDSYAAETGKIRGVENGKIHHELFSLVLAMNGLKARNVKGVMQFSTAIKVISQALDEMLITPGYNVAFEMALNSIMKVSQEKMDIIKNNFCALDLNIQHNAFYYSPSNNIDKFIIDLHDPETLKEINTQYFFHNPLDLMSL